MIDIEIEDDGWSQIPDVEALVARAAEAALAGERGRTVAVLLTDDETVRDLNERFRGKNQPTNVLSFPAVENPEFHQGSKERFCLP